MPLIKASKFVTCRNAFDFPYVRISKTGRELFISAMARRVLGISNGGDIDLFYDPDERAVVIFPSFNPLSPDARRLNEKGLVIFQGFKNLFSIPEDRFDKYYPVMSCETRRQKGIKFLLDQDMEPLERMYPQARKDKEKKDASSNKTRRG